MQMFDRAMKMFTPFGFPGQGADAPASETEETPAAAENTTAKDPALDELKAQLAAMQAQIAKLAEKG
jgi:polyhydroxyalkanoate synthesis regulator protein